MRISLSYHALEENYQFFLSKIFKKLISYFLLINHTLPIIKLSFKLKKDKIKILKVIKQQQGGFKKRAKK